MTFEMDGVQHVALMAGWGGAGGLVGGRAAKAAAGVGSGWPIAGVQGGCQSRSAADTHCRAVAEANPPQDRCQAVEYLKAGEVLYGKHCVGCHGIGAVGGGSIPDLRTMPKSFHDQWDAIVMAAAILADNGMVSMKSGSPRRSRKRSTNTSNIGLPKAARWQRPSTPSPQW